MLNSSNQFPPRTCKPGIGMSNNIRRLIVSSDDMAISKNLSIDGLRGYLALAVVAHHFWISWTYVMTGEWIEPSNTIFRNLGPVAVMMFFAITAFLFYGKLVRSSGRTSWSTLYLGRFLRLTPMYLFCVGLLVAVVLVRTHFEISVGPVSYIISVSKWALFTIWGAPDINNFKGTAWIIAGVTWTLRYEWLFYFLLPAVAFAIRLIGPRWGIRVSILFALALLIAVMPSLTIFGFDTRLAIPFLAGMIAYDLGEVETIRLKAGSAVSSVLVVSSIVLAIALPLATYSPITMLLIGFAFVLIANGNGIFGFLLWKANSRLGEATYSIYLLQGFVLHFIFQALVAGGYDFHSPAIWVALPLAMVILVLISFGTFRLIEEPFIQMGRRPTVQLADAAP